MTAWEDDEVPGDYDEFSPRGLREDLETVIAMLAGITPRVAAMDGRLAEAETTVMRADRRTLEMESTHRTIVAQLRRLSARVEWLERNIRMRGEAEVVLDDVPAAVLRLARVAQEGREESARLLGEAGRAPLEDVLTAHGAAVRELVVLRRAGLAECEVLAGTGWSDTQHRSAAEAFERLMAEYRDVRAEVTRLVGPALVATRELAEDDERRLDGAGAIEAGEEAWEQLQGELRTRLAEAVGDGALLPEWFVAVLGPIPVAAEVATWMEVGTDLLAYRITHGISDPVQALGPPPEGRDDPRADWYQRLSRRLRDLDLHTP